MQQQANKLGSSSAGKEMKVLVLSNLSDSALCPVAKKANSIPACINMSTA